MSSIVRGDEVRADRLAHLPRALRPDLGEADEVHTRMARGDFAAEESDAAAADDRKPDAGGTLLRHGLAC